MKELPSCKQCGSKMMAVRSGLICEKCDGKIRGIPAADLRALAVAGKAPMYGKLVDTPCDTCDGCGEQDGTCVDCDGQGGDDCECCGQWVECAECGGSGVVAEDCEACQGTGELISEAN
jgi:hypothetical protein